MRSGYQFARPLISLLLVSTIASGTAYSLIQGIGLFPWMNLMLVNIIVALSLGLAVTSSIYTSFYRGIFLKNVSPFADKHSMVSEAAIAQILTLVLFITQKITFSAAFIALVCLQMLTSWKAFTHAMQSFKVHERHARIIPWIATGLVAAYAFTIWPMRSAFPVEAVIASTAIWQSLVHVMLVPGVTLWYAAHPRLKLVPHSLLQSAKLRMAISNGTPTTWALSLPTAVINLTAGLLIWFNLEVKENDNLLLTVAAAQFLFVPALIDAWSKLASSDSERKSMHALSRFTGRSISKLFLRYSRNKPNWAATVGLRTSTFTIDHDPVAFLSGKIPASMTILRNEEIQSVVNQLLGHQILVTSSISQRIIGVLDPENTVRPCVDTLNFFATLHLDASSLVESRLSSLAALLPIVNPGLSSHIDLGALSSRFKKSQWFFYFDFSWVDQSMVNTPGSARYGINLEPISEKVRTEAIGYMRRSHGIGSVVWFGKDAQQRLLQEAPNLEPLIEPHHFKLSEDQETLLFAINFENLIPHLQRYYNLDAMRSKIIQYQPSAEAQRLLKILSIQIDNLSTVHEQQRIIKSIASYNWTGFEEKDRALKLLLRIFEMESVKHPERQEHSGSLSAELRAAITSIGYPSQLMNQANLYKLDLRNLPKLRLNALDTRSQRFEESWILLGNMDYSRFDKHAADEIGKIIAEACRKPAIMSVSTIPPKMVDAVIGLLRRESGIHTESAQKLLLTVVQKMIAAKCNAESMTLALDAFTFTAQHTGTQLTLPEDITNYFERGVTSSEDSKAWKQSLCNLWQEYKTRQGVEETLKAG